jgi:folate-binding protein YgfZ
MIKNELLVVSTSIKGDEVRRILSTGIPWNEDTIVLNADESIRKIIISDEKIEKIFAKENDSILELNDYEWLESGDNIISRNNRHKISSLEILMPKNDMYVIKEKLIENEFKMIKENEWNKYRIYVGIINFKEIEHRIPFDVGMKELVKMDKGCYPGQEIHARLESRGKIRKILVKLSCEKFLREDEYKIENGGKIVITTAYDGGQSKSKFFGIIPIKYLELGKIVLNNGITLAIEDVVSFQSLNFHH